MTHLVVVANLFDEGIHVIEEDQTIDTLINKLSETDLGELSLRLSKMVHIINKAEIQLRKKRRSAQVTEKGNARLALDVVNKQVEII